MGRKIDSSRDDGSPVEEEAWKVQQAGPHAITVSRTGSAVVAGTGIDGATRHEIPHLSGGINIEGRVWVLAGRVAGGEQREKLEGRQNHDGNDERGRPSAQPNPDTDCTFQEVSFVVCRAGIGYVGGASAVVRTRTQIGASLATGRRPFVVRRPRPSHWPGEWRGNNARSWRGGRFGGGCRRISLETCDTASQLKTMPIPSTFPPNPSKQDPMCKVKVWVQNQKMKLWLVGKKPPYTSRDLLPQGFHLVEGS